MLTLNYDISFIFFAWLWQLLYIFLKKSSTERKVNASSFTCIERHRLLLDSFSITYNCFLKDRFRFRNLTNSSAGFGITEKVVLNGEQKTLIKMEKEILKFICASQGAVDADFLVCNLGSSVSEIISSSDKIVSCCPFGQPKVVARTNVKLCRNQVCPGSCWSLHLCKTFLLSGSCQMIQSRWGTHVEVIPFITVFFFSSLAQTDIDKMMTWMPSPLFCGAFIAFTSLQSHKLPSQCSVNCNPDEG